MAVVSAITSRETDTLPGSPAHASTPRGAQITFRLRPERVLVPAQPMSGAAQPPKHFGRCAQAGEMAVTLDLTAEALARLEAEASRRSWPPKVDQPDEHRIELINSGQPVERTARAGALVPTSAVSLRQSVAPPQPRSTPQVP